MEKIDIKRILSGLLYAIIFILLIKTDHLILFLIPISILMIGSIYEFIQINTTIKQPVKKIIILIYISMCFPVLTIMKVSMNENLLIFLLLHIWASDIGGLLIGKGIGKNKLSKISPQKTWEGVIGSFLFCFLVALCFKKQIYQTTNLHFIIVSFILCTSSIIGDLIISKIKRINNKKESGKFLPGHGGVLDRLDSMYLTTIIFYFIMCK